MRGCFTPLRHLACREMEWQGDRVYRLPERPLWESGDLGSGSSSATPSPGYPGKLLLPACLSLPVCELGMCSPALLHKVSTRWSSGLLYLIDDYFFQRVSEGFSLPLVSSPRLSSPSWVGISGRPPPHHHPPSLGSLLLPRLRWGVSPESSDPYNRGRSFPEAGTRDKVHCVPPAPILGPPIGGAYLSVRPCARRLTFIHYLISSSPPS